MRATASSKSAQFGIAPEIRLAGVVGAGPEAAPRHGCGLSGAARRRRKWTSPEGETIETTTIVTTEANALVAPMLSRCLYVRHSVRVQAQVNRFPAFFYWPSRITCRVVDPFGTVTPRRS